MRARVQQKAYDVAAAAAASHSSYCARGKEGGRTGQSGLSESRPSDRRTRKSKGCFFNARWKGLVISLNHVEFSDMDDQHFNEHLQGDTARWFKPPVDINTKVPFWPGQVRAGQAKTELLFEPTCCVTLYKLVFNTNPGHLTYV